MTYYNIINRALDLYREGKYNEAYEYMTENSKHVPRIEAQVYDFRASTACRAGRVEFARQLLEEAVLEKGLWYTQEYLTTDQDIHPATELPGFQRILDICAEREKEAISKVRCEVFVVRGKNSDRKKPLIIMLHGNGQNAAVAGEDWRAATEAGYDMAFVQSSQFLSDDAYVWNNIEKGAKDLKEAFDKLSKQGELNGRDVIMAGFSAGARLALHALLIGLVDVKGLILVGPWLPEIDEWMPRILDLRGKGIFILIGDKDSECLPGAKTLADALDREQQINLLHISKGLDHDYPDDFSTLLPTAVKVATGQI